MHEYPSTQRIVERALRLLEEEGEGYIVERIRLKVGDDSGFVGDCIRLYYEMLTENTPLEGSELIIERVKPLLECESCGLRFERKPFSFECPACKGVAHPTEVGKEFYIDTIDIAPRKGREDGTSDQSNDKIH